MEDPNILFGPLSKAKIGKKIYLTDEKKVYVYKITKKAVVDETQVKWIDDVPYGVRQLHSYFQLPFFRQPSLYQLHALNYYYLIHRK